MNMKSVVTAAAMPVDAVALADLINSSYRAQGKDAGWTHEVSLLGGARTDTTALLSLRAAKLDQKPARP